MGVFDRAWLTLVDFLRAPVLAWQLVTIRHQFARAAQIDVCRSRSQKFIHSEQLRSIVSVEQDAADTQVVLPASIRGVARITAMRIDDIVAKAEETTKPNGARRR